MSWDPSLDIIGPQPTEKAQTLTTKRAAPKRKQPIKRNTSDMEVSSEDDVPGGLNQDEIMAMMDDGVDDLFDETPSASNHSSLPKPSKSSSKGSAALSKAQLPARFQGGSSDDDDGDGKSDDDNTSDDDADDSGTRNWEDDEYDYDETALHNHGFDLQTFRNLTQSTNSIPLTPADQEKATIPFPIVYPLTLHTNLAEGGIYPTADFYDVQNEAYRSHLKSLYKCEVYLRRVQRDHISSWKRRYRNTVQQNQAIVQKLKNERKNERGFEAVLGQGQGQGIGGTIAEGFSAPGPTAPGSSNTNTNANTSTNPQDLEANLIPGMGITKHQLQELSAKEGIVQEIYHYFPFEPLNFVAIPAEGPIILTQQRLQMEYLEALGNHHKIPQIFGLAAGAPRNRSKPLSYQQRLQQHGLSANTLMNARGGVIGLHIPMVDDQEKANQDYMEYLLAGGPYQEDESTRPRKKGQAPAVPEKEKDDGAFPRNPDGSWTDPLDGTIINDAFMNQCLATIEAGVQSCIKEIVSEIKQPSFDLSGVQVVAIQAYLPEMYASLMAQHKEKCAQQQRAGNGGGDTPDFLPETNAAQSKALTKPGAYAGSKHISNLFTSKEMQYLAFIYYQDNQKPVMINLNQSLWFMGWANIRARLKTSYTKHYGQLAEQLIAQANGELPNTALVAAAAGAAGGSGGQGSGAVGMHQLLSNPAVPISSLAGNNLQSLNQSMQTAQMIKAGMVGGVQAGNGGANTSPTTTTTTQAQSLPQSTSTAMGVSTTSATTNGANDPANTTTTTTPANKPGPKPRGKSAAILAAAANALAAGGVSAATTATTTSKAKPKGKASAVRTAQTLLSQDDQNSTGTSPSEGQTDGVDAAPTATLKPKRKTPVKKAKEEKDSIEEDPPPPKASTASPSTSVSIAAPPVKRRPKGSAAAATPYPADENHPGNQLVQLSNGNESEMGEGEGPLMSQSTEGSGGTKRKLALLGSVDSPKTSTKTTPKTTKAAAAAAKKKAASTNADSEEEEEDAAAAEPTTPVLRGRLKFSAKSKSDTASAADTTTPTTTPSTTSPKTTKPRATRATQTQQSQSLDSSAEDASPKTSAGKKPRASTKQSTPVTTLSTDEEESPPLKPKRVYKRNSAANNDD